MRPCPSTSSARSSARHRPPARSPGARRPAARSPPARAPARSSSPAARRAAARHARHAPSRRRAPLLRPAATRSNRTSATQGVSAAFAAAPRRLVARLGRQLGREVQHRAGERARIGSPGRSGNRISPLACVGPSTIRSSRSSEGRSPDHLGLRRPTCIPGPCACSVADPGQLVVVAAGSSPTRPPAGPGGLRQPSRAKPASLKSAFTVDLRRAVALRV